MSRTHTVVDGDTLSTLAQAYYGDSNLHVLIARANGLSNPDDIHIGQMLVIPDDPKDLFDTEGQRLFPYASELFGVYQPLIGWRSNLQRTRVAEGMALRLNKAASHLRNVIDVSMDQPVPDIPGRDVLDVTDHTGTAVGRALAREANRREYVDADAWQGMLSDTGDSRLSSISQEVIRGLLSPMRNPEELQSARRLPRKDDFMMSNPVDVDREREIRAGEEAATASLLRHLADSGSDDIIQQMFAPSPQPWQRVLAAVEFFAQSQPAKDLFLSPIGILHRFREYFFELGTFLGPPVGHVWISPGGSVELVEVNTRRTLVDMSVEQTIETLKRSEETFSDKDELSDAVKVENSNDTKLGVTATASGGVGSVFQASGSASFNLGVSRTQAQEQTHKRMREQSSKLSSEVRQNYKTTFRTVTETNDTSSRRYVLQNSTRRLLSYELCRKMRRVAVQVQDQGQQLCWQLYVDNPGDPLGIGEFVHETAAAANAGIQQPNTIPEPSSQDHTASLSLPFILYQGADDEAENIYTTSSNHAGHGIFVPDVGTDNIIEFDHTFLLGTPPAGMEVAGIRSVDFHGAQVKFVTSNPSWSAPNPDPEKNTFRILLTYANFGGKKQLPFDVILSYKPTQTAIDAVHQANAASQKTYDDEVAAKKEQLVYTTLRKRLKLSGSVPPRPQEDLREEERSVIYRAVITKLYGKVDGWQSDDYHVASELIRYFFDVDAMLYFVAPDWWKSRTQKLVPMNKTTELQPTTITAPKLSFGKMDARPHYLITEETKPAPKGASLGWLIQLDGDEKRNAFLNSPWVKAVLPIRPGRERDAIAWLRRPEVAGADGLGEPYPYNAEQDPPEYDGLTIEGVLLRIADKIAQEHAASFAPAPVHPEDVNSTVALPTEMVFARGFDPLAGGIEFGKKPFAVFSEWVEVLPTDQVVATEYKTGT